MPKPQNRVPGYEAEREALEYRLQEIGLMLEAPPPRQPPSAPPLDFEQADIAALEREREDILKKLGRHVIPRSGIRLRRGA